MASIMKMAYVIFRSWAKLLTEVTIAAMGDLTMSGKNNPVILIICFKDNIPTKLKPVNMRPDKRIIIGPD